MILNDIANVLMRDKVDHYLIADTEIEDNEFICSYVTQLLDYYKINYKRYDCEDGSIKLYYSYTTDIRSIQVVGLNLRDGLMGEPIIITDELYEPIMQILKGIKAPMDVKSMFVLDTIWWIIKLD